MLRSHAERGKYDTNMKYMLALLLLCSIQLKASQTCGLGLTELLTLLQTQASTQMVQHQHSSNSSGFTAPCVSSHKVLRHRTELEATHFLEVLRAQYTATVVMYINKGKQTLMYFNHNQPAPTLFIHAVKLLKALCVLQQQQVLSGFPQQ